MQWDSIFVSFLQFGDSKFHSSNNWIDKGTEKEEFEEEFDIFVGLLALLFGRKMLR